MKKRINLCLLLSACAALVFASQLSATPKYLKALKEAYPDSEAKCATCHVKPTGGKELNDYGKKFKAAPDCEKDPVAALKSIGAP